MATSARRPRRRWIWLSASAVVVVALVAAGVWWFGFRNSGEQAAAVTTTTTTQAVSLGSVSSSITASGTFEPVTSADLSFPTSGVLTTLSVSVGDTVTKGQSLASIDPTSLEASLASARATLEASQSSYDDTLDSGTSTEIAAARAEVASNQAKVTSAEQDLEEATLTSPIDGVVAEINDLTVGQTAGSSSSGGSGSSGADAGGSSGSAATSSSSSTAQIVVVDTSAWKVSATLTATDVAKVKVGQAVSATIQTSSSSNSSGGFGGFGGGFPGGGFGGGGLGGGGNANRNSQNGSGSTATATQSSSATSEKLTGTVSSIGLVGTSSTSGGAATFPLTVTLTGTMEGVYDGTSASLEITTEKLDNVLTVPTAAISTQNGSSVVTVVSGDTKTVTTVQVGEVYGTRTQILSGLTGGQMVQVTRTGPAGLAGGSGGLPSGFPTGGALPGGGNE